MSEVCFVGIGDHETNEENRRSGEAGDQEYSRGSKMFARQILYTLLLHDRKLTWYTAVQ